MKTPTITGDPEHVDQMQDFDPADLEEDFGGVHTFSNIHNKAAYNLLTTRHRQTGQQDAAGASARTRSRSCITSRCRDSIGSPTSKTCSRRCSTW